MQSHEVLIKTQTISGIKNPVFSVSGTILQEQIDFVVYVDHKKVDFIYQENSITKEFSLNVYLTTKQKDIWIYIVKDGQETLLLHKKNTLIRRVMHKLKSLIVKPLYTIRIILVTIKRGIVYFWQEYHFLVPPSLWKKYWQDFKGRIKAKDQNAYYNPNITYEYNKWLKVFEKREEYPEYSYQPLISIVIPVYNIEPKYLKDCVSSILNQEYQNFEICICDDASTKEETLATLKELESRDERIQVVYRKKNGNISLATNDAIKIAKGEFIAFMDDDDLLASNALIENVKALNINQKLDLIYSDEDKLDDDLKRCEPNFKPDYSPDTLLGFNYICHFVVVRKTLLEKVGLLRKEFDGAQDYDLLLRIVEHTKNIYHIPKILYHWRKVAGSTAATLESKDYAIERGKRCVEEALKRRGKKAIVHMPMHFTYYIVEYLLPKKPLVSIIIPTKDHVDILKKCIDSIYEKTTYPNFELIICDNQSEEEETKTYLNEITKTHENVTILNCDFPFNYSKINNLAAKKAKGDYFVLLNNDTEILSPNWLELMVGYAMQDHIGTVGVKLLYPDMTIQHAGVVMGFGGVASHVYVGRKKEEIGAFGRLLVPYNYAGNTAACLMVSKKKFLEVGGLEEQLQVAYNDIDFDLKLIEKGYYNVFLPQVEVMHYESKSRGLDTTSEKYKRFQKEENFMYEKWANYIKDDPFYNPNYSKHGWFVLEKKEKNENDKEY